MSQQPPTLNGYIYAASVYSLGQFLNAKTPEDAMKATAVTLTDPATMGAYGWTPLGTCTIAYTLASRDDTINAAITALDEQQRAIRAESERQCLPLEKLKQSLLAIENTSGV